MKVILCENVYNLGDMGAMVSVSSGYARNFLFPRKLAVQADSASAKQIEHELRGIRKKEEKHKDVLREQAKALEALTVEITARAGVEDKLFGSVTSANIAEKLKESGQELDRRLLVLSEPIRSLGIHMVTAKLGNGVEAQIKVWVTKEADETQPVEEEEVEETKDDDEDEE